jgi:hypothetical protein
LLPGNGYSVAIIPVLQTPVMKGNDRASDFGSDAQDLPGLKISPIYRKILSKIRCQSHIWDRLFLTGQLLSRV